jgi:capsid protein
MRDSLIREAIVANNEHKQRQIFYEYTTELFDLSRPDKDEAQWNPVGNDFLLVGGEVPKEQQEQTANRLRAAAYRAYYTNPHAKSGIENLINFTIGKGVQLSLEGDNIPEATLEDITQEWKQFSKRNKFRRLQREFLRRDLRDGEAFLHFLPATQLDPMTFVHFVEPDLVRSSQPQITLGIETEPGDIGNIVSYRINDGQGINNSDVIVEPEFMLHSKLNVDSNVKRGRSSLETVLADLADLKDFRHNRTILNRARSSVVMLHKRKGDPNKLKSEVAQQNATSNTGTRGTQRLKAPKPGTVYNLDLESDVEFKSPNLGSSDAAVDGRMIALAVAAGMGLPEFIITADASNNNMASLKEASLTIVKYVEDMQEFVNEEFCEIFDKFLEFNIAVGRFPEAYRKVECSFKFPLFDIRNVLEETQALALQKASGWVSDSTASAHLGYNYSEELDRMQKDSELQQARGNFADNLPPEDNEPELDES